MKFGQVPVQNIVECYTLIPWPGKLFSPIKSSSVADSVVRPVY